MEEDGCTNITEYGLRLSQSHVGSEDEIAQATADDPMVKLL